MRHWSKTQTGSARGTFKRGDPHPTVANRFFYQYLHNDREVWRTGDGLKNAKLSNKRYTAEYNQRNKERKRRYSAQYRIDNPVATKERQREWLINNRDRKRAADSKWAKINRDKCNANSSKYRARLKCAYVGGDKTSIDALYKQSKRLSILTGMAWHVDHTIPLNKGGPHKPDNLQVVPARWNHIKNDLNSNRWSGNLPALDFDWGALMNGTE
jgi:hypothetical protein